mmetsp:Transcript_65552/g.207306  ORF Transcript_65552/g.207306 Transcript_65552/m.207306 type:complete len:404 (+) Transcript_65552:947-2158(+)
MPAPLQHEEHIVHHAAGGVALDQLVDGDGLCHVGIHCELVEAYESPDQAANSHVELAGFERGNLGRQEGRARGRGRVAQPLHHVAVILLAPLAEHQYLLQVPLHLPRVHCLRRPHLPQRVPERRTHAAPHDLLNKVLEPPVLLVARQEQRAPVVAHLLQHEDRRGHGVRPERTREHGLVLVQRGRNVIEHVDQHAHEVRLRLGLGGLERVEKLLVVLLCALQHECLEVAREGVEALGVQPERLEELREAQHVLVVPAPHRGLELLADHLLKARLGCKDAALLLRHAGDVVPERGGGLDARGGLELHEGAHVLCRGLPVLPLHGRPHALHAVGAVNQRRYLSDRVRRALLRAVQLPHLAADMVRKLGRARHAGGDDLRVHCHMVHYLRAGVEATDRNCELSALP